MRVLALMDTLQAVGVASKGIQSKTMDKGKGRNWKCLLTRLSKVENGRFHCGNKCKRWK